MSPEKDIQINVDGTSSLYTESEDRSSDDGAGSSSQERNSLTGKTLTFNHADFPWRGISVLQDDEPVYYADISVLTPSKPDIVLHRQNEKGPIVGQAHFRWSLSIKAGVGPDYTAMEWTDMRRGGVFRRNYTFDHRGRTYSLRRTHSTANGVAPHQRAMFSHMKVVDEGNGQVIAAYISTLTVKRKRGTINFAKGTDHELEILCVLGFAAWREKIARAAGRSSGSAGGWS